MSKLVVLHGVNKGEQFELQEGTTLVGRAPDCGIVLYDRKVSRHHCQLARRGKHFTLVDLDSTHGTKLNGEPVKGKQSFREGDEIQMGLTTFALSDKEIGGMVEQTATDAARDLEEHSFGFLMGEATGKLIAAHEEKPKGFFARIFSVFSSSKKQ